jgi:hypothetical protein
VVVPATVVISVVIVVIVVVVFVVVVIMVGAVAVVFVLAVVMAVIVPVLFAHFIAVKLSFPTYVPSPIGSFTTVGVNAPISKPRVVSVIHISVEALGAMEPGTCTDEDSADKPLRPVIAERRTTIWRIVEITVRADWGYRDRDRDHRNRCVHSNIDAHLRCRFLSSPHKTNTGESNHYRQFQSLHQGLHMD